MMSHFNLKSLTFYGVAISSVVILFKVVTAYGEANLKAPLAIGGSYRINAQTLPGCLKSDALVLTIKQSGIYLNGSLLPAKSNPQLEKIAEEKPSLTGQLNYPQLNLSGSIPLVSSCNRSSNPDWVQIRGVVNGETLVGQIALNSTPMAVEFTAEHEKLVEQQENPH